MTVSFLIEPWGSGPLVRNYIILLNVTLRDEIYVSTTQKETAVLEIDETGKKSSF